AMQRFQPMCWLASAKGTHWARERLGKERLGNRNAIAKSARWDLSSRGMRMGVVSVSFYGGPSVEHGLGRRDCNCDSQNSKRKKVCRQGLAHRRRTRFKTRSGLVVS